MCEAVIRNLEELGIEVPSFAYLDTADYITRYRSRQFEIAIGSYSEFPDPWYNQVINWMNGTMFQVLTQWYNKTYGELMYKAYTAIGYNELVNYVKQLERIYVQEMPVIPIAFSEGQAPLYRTDKVTNWRFDLSTWDRGFGVGHPTRPLLVNLLEPVGKASTPETPTTLLDPLIIAAVVVVVVVAISLGYIALKRRKSGKPTRV